MPSAREPTVEMDKKNNNNGPARVHAAIGAIATCEVMTALYGCDWMFENVTVTLRGRLLGDRVGEEAKISLALYSDSSSLLFRVLEMKVQGDTHSKECCIEMVDFYPSVLVY
ncbi:hypothetical protein TNCV_3632661 [Trichonephila clavipes]|nr:hypothetical protein TNCV_3632661 [Trichonephila clavipes]